MRDLADELLQAKVKARLFGGDHAPRFGRLVILDKLGAGAMGTVFAAYDPRLDRRVALKVLHADADASQRVLREARALAKLAHPNIVTIHDAGEEAGTVYVVMELATGVPLRAWIDNPERTWRDVVRVMADVAAGLAAAHRAGLVHRDIKPENILVGDDRARVVDFGLALEPKAPPTVPDPEPPAKPPSLDSKQAKTVDLSGRDDAASAETVDLAGKTGEPVLSVTDADGETTTAQLVSIPRSGEPTPSKLDPLAATDLASLGDHGAGTPSYMAPEVLSGSPATAASDQFSFAVTLFEALHGERSHGGSTRAELHAAALQAASARFKRTLPDSVRKSNRLPKTDTVLSLSDAAPAKRSGVGVGVVPAWVDAVVRRALAAHPEDRFPSMVALHAELTRDRTRRRRAFTIAATALVVGGGIGVLVYRARGPTEVTVVAQISCEPERATRVWTPKTATRIRERLGDAPWATLTMDRLGKLAAAWQTSFRNVCEATRVRGEQSDRLLELRIRCLDRTLDRFEAFSDALQAELDDVNKVEAAGAVLQLPQPVLCETVENDPELAVPLDPARRAEARAIEHELDNAWASFALGRYAAARTQVIQISQRVSRLELPALHASVLLLGGAAEARIGEGKQARRLYDHAMLLAAEAKATELELQISTRMLRQDLFQGHRERVIDWGGAVQGAAIRAGHQGAEVMSIVGEALRENGKLAEARERLTEALASRDALREDQRALIEMNLASIDLELGRSEIARPAYQKAYDRARAALGEGHPTLGIHLDRLAEAARARGKLEDALALHDRSIAVRSRSFEREDRALATARFHRAETLLEAGRLAEAHKEATAARAIRGKAYGSGSSRLAEIEALLADIELARNNLDLARKGYIRMSELDGDIKPSRRIIALVHAYGSFAPSNPAGPLDRPRFLAAATGLGLDKDSLKPYAMAEEAGEHEPFTVDRVAGIAARLSLLAKDQADPLIASLLARYRAAGSVDPALTLAVADAVLLGGDRAVAATLYTAALGALADEPSRARLRAYRGLAMASDGETAAKARVAAAALAKAMPELATGT